MTKRDFELIARAIASIDNRRARVLASDALADELEKTNPRFNRARFIAACHRGTQ